MQSFAVHPDDDEERMRRLSAPENEVPAGVPGSAVLTRSELAALTLSGIQVFSSGMEFHVGLRWRPELLQGLDDHDVGSMLWGGRRGRRGGLLLGVEFGDGRRASNAPRPGPARPGSMGEPDGPGGLVLTSRGGSGGQLVADQSWWLNPLPPDGPLLVVVRCDELGLPETVTELDGTAIRAAAADVVTLWPWVSPSEAEPPQPEPPALPADSWFTTT